MSWTCAAARETAPLSGTNLPEQIEVRATQGGVPVRNSPFYLSGECLKRWGVDASATLICNEITPAAASRTRRAGLDWDRLAEF